MVKKGFKKEQSLFQLQNSQTRYVVRCDSGLYFLACCFAFKSPP